MAKKNNQRNVIVVVLIAIAFLFLSIGVSAQGEIQLKQVYTEDRPSQVIRPLTIVTDKTTYIQGEIAEVQDYQDINQFCGRIRVEFKLLSSFGSLKDTFVETLGRDMGYMTLFYKVDVKTSTLSPGTYKLESHWYCDGNKLGNDGYTPDNPFDSTSQPSKASIKVIAKTTPPADVPEEPSCLIRSCPLGTKLANENSDRCFCQDTWAEGDGKCDAGERSTSVDCQRVECLANELLLEGSCIPESRICFESGGTKDCTPPSQQDEKVKNNFTNPIVLFLLTIGIVFFSFGLFQRFK